MQGFYHEGHEKHEERKSFLQALVSFVSFVSFVVNCFLRGKTKGLIRKSPVRIRTGL